MGIKNEFLDLARATTVVLICIHMSCEGSRFFVLAISRYNP